MARKILFVLLFTVSALFAALMLFQPPRREVRAPVLERAESKTDRHMARRQGINPYQAASLKVDGLTARDVQAIIRGLDPEDQDPASAALAVMDYLDINNIDRALVARETRRMVSRSNYTAAMALARQNQAAVFFSMPILKDGVKTALARYAERTNRN